MQGSLAPAAVPLVNPTPVSPYIRCGLCMDPRSRYSVPRKTEIWVPIREF